MGVKAGPKGRGRAPAEPKLSKGMRLAQLPEGTRAMHEGVPVFLPAARVHTDGKNLLLQGKARAVREVSEEEANAAKSYEEFHMHLPAGATLKLAGELRELPRGTEAITHDGMRVAIPPGTEGVAHDGKFHFSGKVMARIIDPGQAKLRGYEKNEKVELPPGTALHENGKLLYSQLKIDGEPVKFAYEPTEDVPEAKPWPPKGITEHERVVTARRFGELRASWGMQRPTSETAGMNSTLSANGYLINNLALNKLGSAIGSTPRREIEESEREIRGHIEAPFDEKEFENAAKEIAGKMRVSMPTARARAAYVIPGGMSKLESLASMSLAHSKLKELLSYEIERQRENEESLFHTPWPKFADPKARDKIYPALKSKMMERMLADVESHKIKPTDMQVKALAMSELSSQVFGKPLLSDDEEITMRLILLSSTRLDHKTLRDRIEEAKKEHHTELRALAKDLKRGGAEGEEAQLPDFGDLAPAKLLGVQEEVGSKADPRAKNHADALKLQLAAHIRDAYLSNARRFLKSDPRTYHLRAIALDSIRDRLGIPEDWGMMSDEARNEAYSGISRSMGREYPITLLPYSPTYKKVFNDVAGEMGDKIEDIATRPMPKPREGWPLTKRQALAVAYAIKDRVEAKVGEHRAGGAKISNAAQREVALDVLSLNSLYDQANAGKHDISPAAADVVNSAHATLQTLNLLRDAPKNFSTVQAVEKDVRERAEANRKWFEEQVERAKKGELKVPEGAEV